MESVQVKKIGYKETMVEYEIESFDEFYARFYDSCNREVYFGGFVLRKKIFWIFKECDRYNVKVYTKNNGMKENLELNIRKALKEYKYRNKITKEEFVMEVSDIIGLKDAISELSEGDRK